MTVCNAILRVLIVASVLTMAAPGVVQAESEAPGPRLIHELLQPAGGDLPDMVGRKFVRALVVYNKAMYFLDGGRERGLMYDLSQALAERLNAGLAGSGQEVAVACIPVSRNDLVPFLAQGKGDIVLADLTATPEREQLVDFSFPFATDIDEILVGGPSGPAVAGIEDLSGREVFVRRSSSYADSLRALNDRLAAMGRPPVTVRYADEHLEDGDILEMVNVGMVGLTVVDRHQAKYWGKVYAALRPYPEVVLRKGGRIAVAVRKGCPLLKAQVDAFVGEYNIQTAKFMYLFNKYANKDNLLHNNLASDDYRRFQEAAVYFKEYAAQYDFDYLLIAAQSYQESRIDQKKRSKSGALGVMQIHPKTAMDPSVGVRNIERLGNNVLAGVKYHRFIIDRYFNDPGIGPVDRQLFAFASYNAGPAKIQHLRQQAKAEGYDPNRWFENVERQAAKHLGNENVRYVSNIYKYYVAYQLAREQEQERARAKKAVTH